MKQLKEKLKSLLGETAARILLQCSERYRRRFLQTYQSASKLRSEGLEAGDGWLGLGGSCYHELARLCISFNSIPTVQRAAMYLKEACSLLPFWALLWPKKPLSENTFENRCSLMITEMECNLFFISIASAVIPHGIKSPGTLQHYKLIPKVDLNKHCLSLIKVISWVFSFWCLQPAVA